MTSVTFVLIFPRPLASRSRIDSVLQNLAQWVVNYSSRCYFSLPYSMSSFVYISLAEEGDIAAYRLTGAGELVPAGRAKAAVQIMPLAVSPDRRLLYAAVRSKPFAVHVFRIDPASGALSPHSTSPLADSFPYISLDRSGRFLFGASYNGHLISLNAIGSDGRVSPSPLQVIPVGRNAHAILPDRTNRFVFVPALGNDRLYRFRFEAGRLEPLGDIQMPSGSGPRHLALSADNFYLYVLNELRGTVTAFSHKEGVLAEVSTTPMGTHLGPGAPRGPDAPPRDRGQDIWAADIHLTPDERFLYISERTSSMLGAFRVNSGRLTYLGATPTEKQPRGFAIDPGGRFLVACGERSETASVYAIDERSGALERRGQYPAGKGANWVEIVEV